MRNNLQEYLDNPTTVEGTTSLILDAVPLNDTGLEFMMNLGCPISIEIREPETPPSRDVCQVCGSTYLIKEGKCTTCYECGWSKCDL